MAKLTTKQRKPLPKTSKPMAPAPKKAMLSPSEKARIVAKANRILGG